VFFAEMLGTMLLLFNVLSTIDIPKEGGGALGVYPIAMSVTVAHLFLLPIDGCSINPTRSFGPSLVAAWAGISGDYYHQQYMFWFGPMIGGALASVIYGMCNVRLASPERILNYNFRVWIVEAEEFRGRRRYGGESLHGSEGPCIKG
jgi:glycerol uptake facilitator-like aquaporin